jgi:hypothetical protein
MSKIRILDEVRLLVSKPEHGLVHGVKGTVVEISWSGSNQTIQYEVEFRDPYTGAFTALVCIVNPSELIVDPKV